MTEEQKAERLYHHIYETCEGIQEHAERIVALEELVEDMLTEMRDYDLIGCCRYEKRARGLGIEVDDASTT